MFGVFGTHRIPITLTYFDSPAESWSVLATKYASHFPVRFAKPLHNQRANHDARLCVSPVSAAFPRNGGIVTASAELIPSRSRTVLAVRNRIAMSSHNET